MNGWNGWPPQAYTKETLADAFEWLKSQPDSVKALAKDSSSLVSLYTNYQLRAQDGISGHFDRREARESHKQTAPVSGEQFKSELKNLAQGLNEFAPAEEPYGLRASPQVMGYRDNRDLRDNSNEQRRIASESFGAPGFAADFGAQSPPLRMQPHSNPAPSSSPSPSATQASLPPHAQRQRLESLQSVQGPISSASTRAQGTSLTGLAALLDANSQIKISRVREGMNLSSDNEALRMLISLGYDRLKTILPVD